MISSTVQKNPLRSGCLTLSPSSTENRSDPPQHQILTSDSWDQEGAGLERSWQSANPRLPLPLVILGSTCFPPGQELRFTVAAGTAGSTECERLNAVGREHGETGTVNSDLSRNHVGVDSDRQTKKGRARVERGPSWGVVKNSQRMR